MGHLGPRCSPSSEQVLMGEDGGSLWIAVYRAAQVPLWPLSVYIRGWARSGQDRIPAESLVLQMSKATVSEMLSHSLYLSYPLLGWVWVLGHWPLWERCLAIEEDVRGHNMFSLKTFNESLHFLARPHFYFPLYLKLQCTQSSRFHWADWVSIAAHCVCILIASSFALLYHSLAHHHSPPPPRICCNHLVSALLSILFFVVHVYHF